MARSRERRLGLTPKQAWRRNKRIIAGKIRRRLAQPDGQRGKFHRGDQVQARINSGRF